MLKIEVWRPKEAQCAACRDTGIVTPRDGHMQIEVGRFCSDCEEGRARWRETIKAMVAADGAANG